MQGGTPSAAGARLAAFNPALKAATAVGSVAAKARRSGHEMANASGGDQPWQ